MAEIINLSKKHRAAIDSYLGMYNNYSRAIRNARNLFNGLYRIFQMSCESINIDETYFELDEKTASDLFSETIQWMFPFMYEADEHMDEYILEWNANDGIYRYWIRVYIEAEEYDIFTFDECNAVSMVRRFDKEGNEEYWNSILEMWCETSKTSTGKRSGR